jgi:adenine-specific DNA-methyltransferase
MLSLFPDQIVAAPETQGIKYAGSKLKLLPDILSLVHQVQPKTVFDGFTGTTRVSQALAKSGYSVISNDIAAWSEVFATCYLLNNQPKEYYAKRIEYLNSLPSTQGWYSEHYGGEVGKGRHDKSACVKRPWQVHNTMKLDAIRPEIDRISDNDSEKSVLLASLMLALDEVDSTIGHYASYLADWSPRSHKTMKLRIPRLFPSTGTHTVSRGDIFEAVKNIDADLAYLDPPYGSNNEKMPPSRVRYSAYYHIWTSICQDDKPALFGKANRRTDTSDKTGASIFEEFRKGQDGRFIAVDAIERLIRQVRAEHIILSYSSGGRATKKELLEALASVGEILEIRKLGYRRNVMAGMRWTNEWIREDEEENSEYMFLLKKH